MPARTTVDSEQLSALIPRIFDQVQNTSANHQKNLVALHKLHAQAATITEKVDNGASMRLTGEKMFEDVFLDMVSRVVVVKKGTSQADRIVKFIGTYIKFINDKAAEVKKEDDEDEDDSTAGRFFTKLLKFLLKGLTAKDKTVRFRCVAILNDCVSHIGELDEDVYITLRSALLERIRDKETMVRVQAVVAVTKLCGNESPDDVEGDGESAIDVLLNTLARDPSGEVRRYTLLNIPLSPLTIPGVLARTRDTDDLLRVFVYKNVLTDNITVGGRERDADADSSDAPKPMGPAHPRALSIAQRELIIQNGLGDRNVNVRNVAAILLGKWVDSVAIEPKDEPENEELPLPGSEEAREREKEKEKEEVRERLIALLRLFDLVENKVAEIALLSIFATRLDVFDKLEFKEAYWNVLTPEKTFLARVFVDHCIATKDDAHLDAAIPVVMFLAFRIQQTYNNLIKDLTGTQDEDHLGNALDEDAQARREEKQMDAEFVIGEMLRIAVNMDYTDEMGRRKMFSLVREMISQSSLPDSLVSVCLDVLRTLSSSERDLIRVVVEVVHELRDPKDADQDEEEPASAAPGMEDEDAAVLNRLPRMPARENMTPEERARADAMDLRCLSLCIGMLERVNGTFEENSTLEGILGELIIPAVKRKELVLREKGLVALGLCCLIARRMALSSFQLFLGQIQAAPEVLKIQVLHIVFDILMVHDRDFLGRDDSGGDKVIDFLLHILSTEESDRVQAVLVIGLAKLVLAGMVSDEKVLKNLVAAYVSPDTVDNQELRQCLSYFLPAYCYASSANQRRMQQIYIPMFEQLAEASRDLDQDQDMVSPLQIAGMMADWTNPDKGFKIEGADTDEMIHFDLASDIVKTLYKDQMKREDKKILCQILGQLYLPDGVDDDKVRTLKLLVHNLQSRRPLRDTTARNAFNRFEAAITKRYAEQLEGFSEEEYRQFETLKELFEFLDDIIPEDEDEDDPPSKTKASRKRRSESVVTEITTSSGGEDADSNASYGSTHRVSKGKGKAKGKQPAKRRRVSGSDQGEEQEDQDSAPPRDLITPKRTQPRRAASVKKPQPLQQLFDEDEEDEEEQDDENDNEEEEEEDEEGSVVPPSEEEDEEATSLPPPKRSSKLPPSKAKPKGAGRSSRANSRQPSRPAGNANGSRARRAAARVSTATISSVAETSFDSIMDEEEDEEDLDEVEDIL